MVTHRPKPATRCLVAARSGSAAVVAAGILLLAGCSGSGDSTISRPSTSSTDARVTTSVLTSSTSVSPSTTAPEVDVVVPLRNRPSREGELAESLLLLADPGVTLSATGCLTFVGEDGVTYGWVAPTGSLVVGDVLSYPTSGGVVETPLDLVRPSIQKISGEELQDTLDAGQSAAEMCPEVEAFTVDNRYITPSW